MSPDIFIFLVASKQALVELAQECATEYAALPGPRRRSTDALVQNQETATGGQDNLFREQVGGPEDNRWVPSRTC